MPFHLSLLPLHPIHLQIPLSLPLPVPPSVLLLPEVPSSTGIRCVRLKSSQSGTLLPENMQRCVSNWVQMRGYIRSLCGMGRKVGAPSSPLPSPPLPPPLPPLSSPFPPNPSLPLTQLLEHSGQGKEAVGLMLRMAEDNRRDLQVQR